MADKLLTFMATENVRNSRTKGNVVAVIMRGKTEYPIIPKHWE